MKKSLTMPQEAQPRNITRADLVLAEGFGLEVDGRMKTVFPTLARDLKAEFPMLQIKVYDAEKKTRTLEHFPLSVQHTRRCGSSWRIRLAGRHRVGVRCGTRGPRPIAQQLFGARL